VPNEGCAGLRRRRTPSTNEGEAIALAATQLIREPTKWPLVTYGVSAQPRGCGSYRGPARERRRLSIAERRIFNHGGGLRVALSVWAVSAQAPGRAGLGPTWGQVFGWEPRENDPFAMVLRLLGRSLASTDRFDGLAGSDQDAGRFAWA
jgi:hypothetical protein